MQTDRRRRGDRRRHASFELLPLEDEEDLLLESLKKEYGELDFFDVPSWIASLLDSFTHVTDEQHNLIGRRDIFITYLLPAVVSNIVSANFNAFADSCSLAAYHSHRVLAEVIVPFVQSQLARLISNKSSHKNLFDSVLGSLVQVTSCCAKKII